MKKLFSLLLVLALATLLMAPAMAEGNVIVTAIADDPQQMDPTLNSYSR